MRRKQCGFTLIELVLVMGILALVASIAAPSFIFVRGQIQTRTAARRLAVAHSLTRATAIRMGRIAELHIDPARVAFWVQVDTSSTGVHDTITVHRDFDAMLAMSSNRSRVCFDSRGLTTTRQGCEPGDLQVTFSSSAHSAEVRATVLGKLLR